MEVIAFILLPGGLDLPTFLLLGAMSAMLVSAAKAGFGGDVGLLAVPLMIYACGGQTALALGLMLPLLVACDYFAMINWWGKWNWRAVVLLLPGTVVGILAAWFILLAMRQWGVSAGDLTTGTPNAVLKGLIGLISLLFVAMQLIAMLSRNRRSFRPRLTHGSGFGAAAGLTSTFAHAAGPVISMYMLPQDMPKGRYVASTVLFFWICNQLKLVPYISLGMINVASLVPTLVLLPAAVAGTVLGVYLHNRVQQKHFVLVVYVLLTLAGLHLVSQSVHALCN